MALNLLPGDLLLVRVGRLAWGGNATQALAKRRNLALSEPPETGSRRPDDRWTDRTNCCRTPAWGDHGGSGGPPRTLRRAAAGAPISARAKQAFVHELVRWKWHFESTAQWRPRAGCGPVASAAECRILSRDYGFEVPGISISQAQDRRQPAHPRRPACRFSRWMDALALDLADGSVRCGLEWEADAAHGRQA